MNDKFAPTIEPTPCVDMHGVYVSKGMTVRCTSTEHKPPYNKVTQEGVVISDPVFIRNIWGDHHWITDLKGNGWSRKFTRVHEVQVVTAERVNQGPTDVEVERAAIARWLRSEPETVRECNGHRHKDGKKCLVITPMTLEELADAIAKGDYPKETT
jgi:hypothetical protein